MDLRKFVFCFLIDVWFNSKIYLNVSEFILKYLQNLSSSLSKSSRRLWNSPKLSRLKFILCNQKRLFLVNKRLLHQILSINENTCTWFDILAVQKCQLHCFQFGSARLAMWIVTRSARFSSVRLGWQCEWALRNNCRTLPTSAALSRTKSALAGTPSAIWSRQDSHKRNEMPRCPYRTVWLLLLLAAALSIPYCVTVTVTCCRWPPWPSIQWCNRWLVLGRCTRGCW